MLNSNLKYNDDPKIFESELTKLFIVCFIQNRFTNTFKLETSDQLNNLIRGQQPSILLQVDGSDQRASPVSLMRLINSVLLLFFNVNISQVCRDIRYIKLEKMFFRAIIEPNDFLHTPEPIDKKYIQIKFKKWFCIYFMHTRMTDAKILEVKLNKLCDQFRITIPDESQAPINNY